MKINLILLTFLITNTLQANEIKIMKDKDVEVLLGAYTYHYMGRKAVARAFKNKVADNGRLIANPTIGATYRRYTKNLYHSDTIVFLKDSIGSDAFGYLRSFGGKNKHNWYAGLVAGTYLINRKKWEAIGFKPPVRANINSVYTLIPVFAIQISKRFELPNDHYISINNIFSLYITNHTISIGKNF